MTKGETLLVDLFVRAWKNDNDSARLMVAALDYVRELEGELARATREATGLRDEAKIWKDWFDRISQELETELDGSSTIPWDAQVVMAIEKLRLRRGVENLCAGEIARLAAFLGDRMQPGDHGLTGNAVDRAIQLLRETGQ